MIKLSSRLMSIAEFITDGASFVDIGCDHALLDVYLAINRKNVNIIASDINSKALLSAKENVRKYKVKDKVKLCVSNGLDDIDTTSLDTIVISGMGAHTMVGILYNNLAKLKSISTLILQSNNDLDFLRYKVSKIGYYIADEVMVSDAGIIYTVIVFKKGYRFYSKKELYFGPILLKNRDKIFLSKIKSDLEKLEKFYPMIPKLNFHHRYITYRKIKWIRKIISKD